tara:strand:+ start:367 stop:690 length:324 start_codon:yes stop_codon:yes gene_type:complete
MNFPVIENCDGCGACCFEQSSPPSYLESSWPDPEDMARYHTLPADAKAVLDEYRERLMAGEIQGDVPCCWLDTELMQCRFYSHRPNICRDFEVGSEGCRTWRDEYCI